MCNKEIEIICAMSRVIFRTLPFANCQIFPESSLPWSVKYFMHGRKTFKKRHSEIQRRSRPKLFGACELLQPDARALLMLVPQIGVVFHTLCTWNYYPSHLSNRRDDVRLSCLLAQALMRLESIATLSDTIQLYDYIT